MESRLAFLVRQIPRILSLQGLRFYESSAMSAAFEKSNLDWQIQQLSWRVGEWVEIHLIPRSAPGIANAPSGWFLEELLKVAFWAIVLFASIWLGWQLWRFFSIYLSPANSNASRWLKRPSPEEEHDRTVAAWLRQVQEFQRQGNYREACRALYLAMLQRLSDTHLLPHQPSRTDGEYLRAVQQLPQAQSYQTLISTHERLCFGNAAISTEDLRHCQQAYQKIEQESREVREPGR